MTRWTGARIIPRVHCIYGIPLDIGNLKLPSLEPEVATPGNGLVPGPH